jgi:hypothetical protein
MSAVDLAGEIDELRADVGHAIRALRSENRELRAAVLVLEAAVRGLVDGEAHRAPSEPHRRRLRPIGAEPMDVERYGKLADLKVLLRANGLDDVTSSCRVAIERLARAGCLPEPIR